jgi:Type I phosphodiesterase / nucleotide pyrophosphatase
MKGRQTLVGMKAGRSHPFFLLAVCMLLFSLCIVVVHNKIFIVDALPVAHTSGEPVTVSEVHQGRTLIIMLDSARSPEVFDPSYMPFVSQLRNKGAWGYSEVMSFPMSIAGDHAMFEGKIDSVFSLEDDFDPEPSKDDNLFRRLTAQGKKVILIGELIHPAYKNDAANTSYHPADRLFSQYRSDAKSTYEQAFAILQKRDWDVAVVQFVSLDYLGHLETPKSPNNKPLYRQVDGYVQRLLSLTDDKDTVLITAEHGMDDHGFHIDRSPLVIHPPFILLGPAVRKQPEALHVFQIDWAPTLSILSGVDSVYPSFAIPALQLLMLPPEAQQWLIQRFARHLDPHASVTTEAGLEQLRTAKMTKGGTAHLLPVLLLLALCCVGLLMYLILQPEGNAGNASRTVGYGLYSVALLVSLISLNVMHIAALVPPFSANFILGHVFIVAVYLLGLFLVGLAMRWLTRRMANADWPVVLLTTLSPFIAVLFISSNLYHVISWLLMGLPLFALGASGRWQWLGLFLVFWGGLFIRRLSFYTVHGELSMSDQWIPALCMILIAAAISWFYRRRRIAGYPHPLIPVLALLPALAVVMVRPAAAFSALALVLALLPVILLARKNGETRDLAWAAWTSIFYIGTSGILNHLTHMVALPMFLLVWSCIRKDSSRFTGLISLWVLWTMYILAGNTFDLRLSDLTDPFIMGTAKSSGIEYTALTVVARYFIPLTILVGIATSGMQRDEGYAQAACALFPLILSGIAVFYSLMVLNTAMYPWQDEIRMIFISIALFLLFASFITARGLNKLGLWKTAGQV